MIRQPDATMQATPQDNQLMSKHRVLSLKPQLRLEWQAQDGLNETEQPEDSASLGDSITSSTRISFSVHTDPVKRGYVRSCHFRGGNECGEVSLPARCSQSWYQDLLEDRLTDYGHSLARIHSLPSIGRRESWTDWRPHDHEDLAAARAFHGCRRAGSDRTGRTMRPRTRRHGRNHPGLRPVRRQCFGTAGPVGEGP